MFNFNYFANNVMNGIFNYLDIQQCFYLSYTCKSINIKLRECFHHSCVYLNFNKQNKYKHKYLINKWKNLKFVINLL